MRKITLAVLLLVGACSSSPEAERAKSGLLPRQDAAPAKVDMKDARIRAQMHRLVYVREGVWQPVRIRGGVALTSRDRYGARLLLLRKTAGYDVFQLDLECSRKGGYSLSRGLGATRDDLAPTTKSPSPGYLDMSAEMRRVCAQKKPLGRRMSLDSAVTGMRTLVERDAHPEKPVLGPADRKAAMEAMARYRAAQAHR